MQYRRQFSSTVFLALVLYAWPTHAEWGGEGCGDEAALRGIVDNALVAAPAGGGRGSGAPGYSVAVEHDGCGVFAYANGLRRLQGAKPNQVSTRQHIGSMTKPVATALTLMLAEEGLLGRRGIDAKVAGFFTKAERQALTKGTGSEALCPATVLVLDRELDEFVQVRAKCPKLKKITIRQLLNGNHGLWDFVNEVDRNGNGFTDVVDYLLGDLLDALGLERLPVPDVDEPFEVLSALGLLKANGARRGGTRQRDFEASFGNSGYQLVGLILERASGKSFDELVEERIVEPLGLAPMELALSVPRRLGKLASQYAIATGATDGIDENLLGAYPLVDINGHPALDTFDAGPILFSNGGGAAGALTATPESYARFFHSLVTGSLLSAEAQALLEAGFLPVQGTLFEHGFALFRVSGTLGTLLSKGGTTVGTNCNTLHSLEGSNGGNGVTAVVCRNSLDLFVGPQFGTASTSIDTGAIATDLLQAAR